ncbi:tyrosine kinase catalytic domain protein, partial [Rhizoctonia solani AG-3 Rhs1AP]
MILSSVELLSSVTDQSSIVGLASFGEASDRLEDIIVDPSTHHRNNKIEDSNNDADTPGSITNNLPDDHIDRQTVAGASGERVVNLTKFITKTMNEPYAGGGFSLVYKGIYHKSGEWRDVAIKCPYLRHTWGDDVMKMRFKKRVSKELATWSKLRHPNIIELLGYIDGAEFENFVMDWCPGGTLKERLAKTPRVSQLGLVGMLLQFTSGLAHMHMLDIVHSDLKPENVLIGPTGEIKISDFGLSRIMRNVNLTSSSISGTIHYNSPELIMHDLTEGPATTLSSDIWAFGVVAYQLLQHSVNPMPHSHQATSLFDLVRVKSEGYPPYPTELGNHSNEIVCHLMEQIAACWAVDPSTRPKMQHLTTKLYEHTRWSWLFDDTGEHDPRTNVLGGANSEDLLRDASFEYQRGRYKESQGLRAKAAVAELFRGNLFQCAEIQRKLADSCARQFERETMIRHYNSAICKYKSLGPAYSNSVSECEKARDQALDNRSPGAYEWLHPPLNTPNMIRQIADKGEAALDQNDFITATKHFEELVDVARRENRMDIMVQAYDSLARTCQYEARHRLVQAKEHYTTALDCAKQAGATLNQRIMEGNLKRLEVWSLGLEL